MMAPQTSIPPAANALGTIGTVCWCVQLLPQIWHSYRRQSTEGLPSTMMLLWSTCGVPFGVYAIVQNFNIPLQIQPQCFCLLCLISWAQCKYYSSKWKIRNVVSIAAVILCLDAVIEVILALFIRKAYQERNLEWPMTLMGVLATIILVIGFIPIIFELIKRRGRAVGISFIFLAIDWSGAFFSLMSLVAQTSFDPLFATLYGLCACIELGIFVSHGIWLLRTRSLRAGAANSGVDFDHYPEAIEWQKGGLKSVFGRNLASNSELVV